MIGTLQLSNLNFARFLCLAISFLRLIYNPFLFFRHDSGVSKHNSGFLRYNSGFSRCNSGFNKTFPILLANSTLESNQPEKFGQELKICQFQISRPFLFKLRITLKLVQLQLLALKMILPCTKKGGKFKLGNFLISFPIFFLTNCTLRDKNPVLIREVLSPFSGNEMQTKYPQRRYQQQHV